MGIEKAEEYSLVRSPAASEQEPAHGKDEFVQLSGEITYLLAVGKSRKGENDVCSYPIRQIVRSRTPCGRAR